MDYLQGYYLSYPQSNPQEVFDESIQTIKKLLEEKMMKNHLFFVIIVSV